jgi:cobalt-zinc-cadmium efflux system outer membrane protein
MNNPTLLAAQRHAAATRANEITAGLRQNPNFTAMGQDVTLPADNPGNPYFYSANVSRLFERGDKRQLRLDSARASSVVAEDQYKDQERQVLLTVKQAFTSMLLAKAALDIAQQNLSDYRKTVDLSRDRFNAGDISHTDFERIDLQLAQFESDADTAQLNLRQAGMQLQTLLGVAQPSPIFDIVGTLAPPELALSVDDLEQKALAARPDYLAAQETVNTAVANIRLADAGGTADPTLAAEFERSGIDTTFGASLQIPLRLFDRNQGEKQRTRIEADASRLAVTAARNQVVSDLEQAMAALNTARLQSARFHGHYLDEAAQVRDNLQFSYRNGNATLLDYLDALRSYRSTNLSAINADAQVWLAIHQLSFAAATEILP